MNYGSSSKTGKPRHRGEGEKMRRRNEKSLTGTMTLLGRSGAAFGDQSTLRKCRLRYVVGLTASTLRGPCQFIQWASKFTRKLVRSSLGGEFAHSARCWITCRCVANFSSMSSGSFQVLRVLLTARVYLCASRTRRQSRESSRFDIFLLFNRALS